MIWLMAVIVYLIIGCLIARTFSDEEIALEFLAHGIPEASKNGFLLFVITCWLPILIIEIVFFRGSNTK